MQRQESEENNPALSVFELVPVLIPYFLGFFVFRGIFVSFPLYMQIKLQLTELETVSIWAIISGVALLVGALTRLPAGLLSDRIGRVRAFALAYTIYFLSLALILLTTNSLIYVVALSLVRFGVNTIAMTGRSIVSTATRDRALKNGLLSSAVGLGSFIGPYLLGYVLDTYHPDVMIYVMMVFVLADVGLFLIFFKVVDTWFDNSDESRDLSYDAVPRSNRINYVGTLRTDGVYEILFLFFSAGLVFGLITQTYSIYGFNVLALSTTVIGLVSGAGSLVQTFWAPVTGRLYEFVRDEYLRIAAWVMIAASTVLIVLSPFGAGFFIASFFVLNFGNSTYFTMEITRMSKIIEKHEFSFVFGLASSLIILATSIAGFVSSYLYGISPEMNFQISLLVAVVSLVMVIINSFKWSRQRNSKLSGASE